MEGAAAAAVLEQQTDAADDDIALHGLAHVIDDGSGGLGGDDGFHLHARGAGGAGLGLDAHAGRGIAHLKAHVHEVQVQGMAERDQFRGALGGHDAAHLGAGQHVALGQGAFLEQFQGIGRKLHDGFGNGHTLGVGLGAHVHHGDVAVLVQMGKIVLHEAYPCIKSVPCCVAHGQAQGKAAGACRAGRERKMAGRKFFYKKHLPGRGKSATYISAPKWWNW